MALRTSYVDGRDGTGRTALHIAANERRLDVIEALPVKISTRTNLIESDTNHCNRKEKKILYVAQSALYRKSAVEGCFCRRGAPGGEGGRGREELRGPHADLLRGGRGADRIHLSRGQDQILDFKPQQGDRLISKNKFSFVATELDGNLILSDIKNHTQITLHNISLITALTAQPELFS